MILHINAIVSDTINICSTNKKECSDDIYTIHTGKIKNKMI